MSYPILGIAAHERIQGAYTLADVRSTLRMMPLDEALRTHWPSGALLTTYVVDGERAWPRINKRGTLPDELKKAHGSIVRTAVFGFDFDLPKVDGKKSPWGSQGEVREVLAKLRSAPPPTAVYVTRHGLRLIYVLEAPIDPWEGEGYYSAMLANFARMGVEFDAACQNWDRLFRLPFVTLEDGTQTWDNPIIGGGLLLRGGRLSLAGITPHSVSREVGGIVERSRDLPYVEDALKLVEFIGSDNKPALTAWGKVAQRQLRGRDYYEAVFEGAPLPCPHGRDNGILAAVSSAVGLMVGHKGTTPEHIFGLFARAVAALPADPKASKSWTQILWDQTNRIWSIESSKVATASATADEQKSEIVAGYSMMLAGQGKTIPTMPTRPQFASDEAWVLRHSIATDGRIHYILQPDGSFRPLPSTHSTLVSDIHTTGMARFYPMVMQTATGAVRPRTPQQILDVCAVTFHRREGEIGERRAALEFRNDGERVLHIPLYRLNEELLAEAAPCDEVDEWLLSAFGVYYERVCEWIAHSLDLTRGICALSIVGPPQTGKSLLAWVLAQCLARPQKCDVQVFGRFNAGLADSPFVHVDEGLESMVGAGRTVDETFRVMTTGGSMSLEQKGQPVFQAKLYPRLILTANASNIIEAIAGRRDLSLDARTALEERLLMVSTQSEGTEYFSRLGHDGVENKFFGPAMRAPRHFLWLYKNRKPVIGKRLLVEGERGTDMFSDLSRSSPKAQIVVRAVLEMLQMGSGQAGIEIIDGRLYVSPTEIERYVDFSFRGQTINARQVGLVFRETDLGIRRCKSSSSSAQMWEVSWEILLSIGEAAGKNVAAIRKRILESGGRQSMAVPD